jgi:hypothetical protein
VLDVRVRASGRQMEVEREMEVERRGEPEEVSLPHALW